MAIAETAAPRFDMGRVVKRTFSVIGNNVLTFGLLSLIVAIPAVALSWFDSPSAQGFQFDFHTIGLSTLTWLVYVITTFVLQAALVHGTIVDLNGKRASFVDCLSTGFRHLLPLIAIALLYSLFVGVGFLFLVVPGIIVAVILSMAVPARVVEHLPVMVALDRSQDLTKGCRWQIFGLFVVYVVLLMIISTVLLSIAGLNALTSFTSDQVASTVAATHTWPVIAASAISSMIDGVVGATGTASIYYELRQIKEGIGPEALASVFD